MGLRGIKVRSPRSFACDPPDNSGLLLVAGHETTVNLRQWLVGAARSSRRVGTSSFWGNAVSNLWS